MRTDDTIALERHALGTLNYIRRSIEAAGVLAVPGVAGVAMGIVGVAAALLSSMPTLRAHWLEIWLAAAVIAFVLGGVLMAREGAHRGLRLARGPLRRFLLCLCPSLAAGAVLTAVLWHAGIPRLIPGTWLLLYGSAVLSASAMISPTMVRQVGLMGGLFLLYGMVAFQLPLEWQSFVLGLGFGGLHIVFGLLIARASRSEAHDG